MKKSPKHGIIMLTSPEGGVIHDKGFIRAAFIPNWYCFDFWSGSDGGFHSGMDSLVWSHPGRWNNGHLSVFSGDDYLSMS